MRNDIRTTLVDILVKCHRIHMGLTIVDLIVLLVVYENDGLYMKKELSDIIGMSHKQINISVLELTSHRKSKIVYYPDGTCGEPIDDMRLLKLANNRHLYLTERGKRVCRSIILSAEDVIQTMPRMNQC